MEKIEYTFDFDHLRNLDIVSNTWLPYGRHGEVYRTDKGTGHIYFSDCMGNYDTNNIYRSWRFQIDWSDGGWSCGLEATSWEMAKQKVEQCLNG